MTRTLSACLVVLIAALPSLAQIGFGPATTLAASPRPGGAVVANLTGDANPDLAVIVDAPDRVLLFTGTGGGNFGPPTAVFLGAGVSADDLVAADFDGDGDIDLAVSQKNTNSLRILINTGGVFSLGGTFATAIEPRRLAVGDLDGNGSPDLVTASRDANSLSVLLNTGGGTFGPAVNLSAGTEPRHVAIGDFNGDGAQDLATSAHDSRNVAVFINTGNGTFGPATFLSVGGQLRPDGIVAADLDGDLDTDLAATTSGNGFNFVSVFINTGGGVFVGPTNFPTNGLNPGSLVAADFDLDGAIDLAASNEDSSNVSVLRNLGGATFGAPLILTGGIRADDLALGDVDGNGGMDLVAVWRDSDQVTVHRNQSGGVVPSIPSLTLVGTPTAGATVTLQLQSTADAGRSYICGFSTGNFPGIFLSDGRRIPLNLDGLLLFSINPGNPLFLNTNGILDGTGRATVTMIIPNQTGLAGATVFAAFVTADPASPTGVGTISPSRILTLQ